MVDLTAHWDALAAQEERVADRAIASLFADQDRAAEFSVEATGLLFDYSKTNLDVQTRSKLIALADAAGVAERRAAMFGGARINETEDRAVLHVALRAPDDVSIFIDNQDVMPEIRATRARMAEFAEQVRSGQYQPSGAPIHDVINIGIGGSDLGPAMAAQALAPFQQGPRLHFVSNVDGAQIHDVLAACDPLTTLVIVASKTFTTIETMTNARTAQSWLAARVAEPGRHFVALSSNAESAGQWGIPIERVFGFADWVGGRYSVWGPIGLSLMICIGADEFANFLRGAAEMDAHFVTAPFVENMPVLLALTGIWHAQVQGHATRAVLPYDQRLARLPAYLQQLEMESNGKRVALDGRDLATESGPVVWGEPGTNGQHAFYQLLHQGTRVVPCEFLIAAKAFAPDLQNHHDLLVANCLAQSEALMRGRSVDEARSLMAAKGVVGAELERQARHRVFPGNRPSVTLAYEALTPYRLGTIIALYEHRVFVEGVILGINSFDQWGVELGKELANQLTPMVTGAQPVDEKDGSTRALLGFLRSRRG